MDTIELKISGLDQLEHALEELPPKAARRAMKEAMFMAPQIWAEEMRATVERYSGPDPGIPPGYLAEHIGTATRVAGDGLSAITLVGPERGDYPDRGGGFRTKSYKKGTRQVGRIRLSSVAGYLEFGTRRSQPFPFIRAAFETGGRLVLDKFTSDLRNTLIAAGLKLS
ncbi:MAG: hypothetical protein ACLP1Y_07685 [Candidatus Acidiferrales bacterium]